MLIEIIIFTIFITVSILLFIDNLKTPEEKKQHEEWLKRLDESFRYKPPQNKKEVGRMVSQYGCGQQKIIYDDGTTQWVYNDYNGDWIYD